MKLRKDRPLDHGSSAADEPLGVRTAPGGQSPGVGAMATKKPGVRTVEPRQRPAAGVAAAQRTAELAQLGGQQRRRRPGPDLGEEGGDGLLRERVEHGRTGHRRGRPLGVHVQPGQ